MRSWASSAVAFAACFLPGSAVAQQTQCHDYVIMSIRGTYEGQGPSIAFPGMINTTLPAIPNGIVYDVVYPAATNGTAYLGAEDAVRYIDAGLQSCPNQKYAILGYSQGASATAIALRNYTDLESAGYKAIAAIIVVGNPYHKPGASVNVDQSNSTSTRDYAGSRYNSTLNSTSYTVTAIPDIFYSDGKLVDICVRGDIVCCPEYPDANFLPNHVRYGYTASVQEIGYTFLIRRLNATISSSNTSSNGGTAGGSGGGQSSTSTSSSPPSTTSPTGGVTPSATTPPGAGSILRPDTIYTLIAALFSVMLVVSI